MLKLKLMELQNEYEKLKNENDLLISQNRNQNSFFKKQREISNEKIKKNIKKLNNNLNLKIDNLDNNYPCEYFNIDNSTHNGKNCSPLHDYCHSNKKMYNNNILNNL